jgi:outer membrane protein FlgP
MLLIKVVFEKILLINNGLINVFHLILLVSFLGMQGCSLIYDKHIQWQTAKPDEFPIIYGIGYAPISLQKAEHKTQRMLMAIQASKVAAYAELAEQIYGQQVNGEMTVADLLLENQQLTSSVHGLIRGAKVVKSYPVGDVYTTELSLDFRVVYEIYNASSNRREIRTIEYY